MHGLRLELARGRLAGRQTPAVGVDREHGGIAALAFAPEHLGV
jgi:hypothetical protein